MQIETNGFTVRTKRVVRRGGKPELIVRVFAPDGRRVSSYKQRTLAATKHRPASMRFHLRTELA